MLVINNNSGCNFELRCFLMSLQSAQFITYQFFVFHLDLFLTYIFVLICCEICGVMYTTWSLALILKPFSAPLAHTCFMSSSKCKIIRTLLNLISHFWELNSENRSQAFTLLLDILCLLVLFFCLVNLANVGSVAIAHAVGQCFLFQQSL